MNDLPVADDDPRDDSVTGDHEDVTRDRSDSLEGWANPLTEQPRRSEPATGGDVERGAPTESAERAELPAPPTEPDAASTKSTERAELDAQPIESAERAELEAAPTESAVPTEPDAQPTGPAEFTEPAELAASSEPAQVANGYDTRPPAVGQPFRTFVELYGASLCGAPVSGVVVEDGIPTQYFERVALEEHEPGRVRLKALGKAWIESHGTDDGDLEARQSAPIRDVARDLPRHPSREYPSRPLADVRYLVIHHTGGDGTATPEMIAREHVEANGWPGIGYHFVIDRAGNCYRTQDLTTVSNHARQFNPVAVGIALCGDFQSNVPPPEQLETLASVIADLRLELGLAEGAVRGHREMVPTPCPGDTFLRLWKPRIERLVEQRMSARRRAIATPVQ